MFGMFSGAAEIETGSFASFLPEPDNCILVLVVDPDTGFRVHVRRALSKIAESCGGRAS